MKSPSSTLPSMKLKTLVHTFIFSHLNRIARALTKAKPILIQLLKEIQIMVNFKETTKKKKKKKKLFLGSFRLHYNWCSSHVYPTSQVYYDATWNSVISTECADDIEESELSGYLNWLEHKVQEDSMTDNNVNEIDRLADMFIASCHEKFRIEKQESYRRFQEMMARSV